jgi:molybdopterin converting factor subunit 1
MKLRVLLFAAARDRAGVPELTVQVPAGGTVGDVRRAVAAVVTDAVMATCAIAVNHEYADDTRAVEEADDVAVIPPVSGG